VLKKKLSSKEHIQLTLSHQDRFHTIQSQYAQTLNAFQEDLQKLQKIELSRKQIEQRVFQHQIVL
jgi:translation initiation factor IF-3